jgi:hypothetical protein
MPREPRIAAAACCLRRFGSVLSRFRNAQVPADFAGKWVGDLDMPGDSGAPIVGRVAPPRMPPPLADKHTAVPLEMADQIVPLHGLRLTSS